MIGSKWTPSVVADEMYSLMENYMEGSDTYNYELTEYLIEWFSTHDTVKEWQLGCTDWPDMTGGVCYISWVENGSIHMEAFEYKYSM